MSVKRNNLVLWSVTSVTCVVALLLGTVIAPPDAVQGNAQRLMYLHVPAAWTAYLCFFVVLIASLCVLLRRSARAGRAARAAAETGLAMTALTLATGSLWGGLTWGTWWASDARVLSTLAMGCVYLIYLAARALTEEEHGSAGVAALGVIGFAIVPVVHFSVLWWRTLHQPPTILAPQLEAPIDGTMLVALGAAVLAFMLLAATIILARTQRLSASSAQSHGRDTLNNHPGSERVLQ